jgi:hypothetical protein
VAHVRGSDDGQQLSILVREFEQSAAPRNAEVSKLSELGFKHVAIVEIDGGQPAPPGTLQFDLEAATPHNLVG